MKLKNKQAFTLVEIIIALAISSFVLIAAIVVWTQSSSSMIKGESDLSNLYESGRIFALIRKDLDTALYIEPPYSKIGDPGNDTLEFTTIPDGYSRPVHITWKYNSSKRVVKRVVNGSTTEYGRGKIGNFTSKTILFPQNSDITNAKKASVIVSLDLTPKNGKIEEGRKISYTHVITPLNFNLFLKSKYNFK